MTPPRDEDREWEIVMALADGHLPPVVDPDSLEGRSCLAIIKAVEADLAVAPPMSDATKNVVVALLRGTGHTAA